MVRGSGSEDLDSRIWILNYARSTRPQAKLSSAPADGADDAEVDRLKAAGNEAFKKGDFSGAVSNYDKAH